MSKLVLPSDREPAFNPQTGVINPTWLKFFQELVARMNAGGL